MIFSKPVTEIIKDRFSCRDYSKRPLKEEKQKLLEMIANPLVGPLGSSSHYVLLAAEEGDREALKGLGTYGYIRDATAFMIGVVEPGEKNLEDFGYIFEKIVLYATDLNLGTCWLGGTFTKSSFANRISLSREERIPAVISLGYIADVVLARQEALRQKLHADHRFPWETLFFDQNFSTVLTPEKAGPYATPLAMLRLSPSAANKQPWRVVAQNDGWHFYLQRNRGYRDHLLFKVIKLDDMQRIDLGIAMCHFELTASEAGLKGHWELTEPSIKKPDDITEYIASWIPES
jgi:hypothetical protein